MSRIPSFTIPASLIGSGVLAWTLAGRPLVANQDLNSPLNPLGINGSPYGEVFAMAMQGPIDTTFHGAIGSKGHNHDQGGECATCGKAGKPSSIGNLHPQNILAYLDEASQIRTNPKSSSDAHKRYLRRQVEDKLRFAYHLDPSHYANYNSLHFFLSEPALGTRPQLTHSAAKLAEETIQYCLKQENDPRPALTAAAATSNILELMFNDQLNPSPRYDTTQMRKYLALLDHCLSRYAFIAKQWDDTRNWELLSPQRIQECDDRYCFIGKFRETALATIERFEGKTHSPQASN